MMKTTDGHRTDNVDIFTWGVAWNSTFDETIMFSLPSHYSTRWVHRM